MKRKASYVLIALVMLAGLRANAQQLSEINITKGHIGVPFSSLSNDSDSCANALDNVVFDEQNGLSHVGAFDTMQWYIRHCYPNANAGDAWGGYEGSWADTLMFPGMRDS